MLNRPVPYPSWVDNPVARPKGSAILTALLLTLSASCTGAVSSQEGDDEPGGSTGQMNSGGKPGLPDLVAPDDDACKSRVLPVEPLRRLSGTHYENTIRDLFGPTLAPDLLSGSIFPPTLYSSGFEADAEANAVGTLASNAIEDNAERMAAIVLARADAYVRGLMPCSFPDVITDSDIDGCVNDYISSFGLRAYRRPLTENEHRLVRDLYDTVRAADSARDAFVATVQFFVQSPALLYRVERGLSEVDADGSVKLSDYEMASRLSYLFLGSMPDLELFEAAASGRLSSPEDLSRQALRLMSEQGFEASMGRFHRDWLHLDALKSLVKDSSVFPSFNEDVRRSLVRETDLFIKHVLNDSDGSVSSLLGSSYRPVDAILAEYYGVEARDASEDNWVVVETPERRGLLLQASLMATLADDNRSNPIHRGGFFTREILCQELPPLPDDISAEATLQSSSGLPTARERLAPLLTDVKCKSCHAAFNPIGLALENFDGAGRWRNQEQGADIIADGEVDLGGEMKTFSTPQELAELIAHSEEARSCYAKQWYRAALGRREFSEDNCGITSLQLTAAKADGDIRSLLAALIQTDAFRFRRAVLP